MRGCLALIGVMVVNLLWFGLVAAIITLAVKWVVGA